jgi:type VI secretion system secreted protein Hcp
MPQEDFFLKIEGVTGESQDKDHSDEIHLSSFSFGVTNSATGGSNLGSGAGRSNVQDLHCTKHTDKASAMLFIGCCTGKHFTKATLTVRRAGEDPVDYLQYEMTETFITSWSQSGHEGGGLAQESFSLNFSKIKFSYWPQKAEGGKGEIQTKTYDVKANKWS